MLQRDEQHKCDLQCRNVWLFCQCVLRLAEPITKKLPSTDQPSSNETKPLCLYFLKAFSKLNEATRADLRDIG